MNLWQAFFFFLAEGKGRKSEENRGKMREEETDLIQLLIRDLLGDLFYKKH